MADDLQSIIELQESLEETLEIMQDDELMTAFREGVEALENGETVAWDDVRRELGLE